jgi:hypothetical protein
MRCRGNPLCLPKYPFFLLAHIVVLQVKWSILKVGETEGKTERKNKF